MAARTFFEDIIGRSEEDQYPENGAKSLLIFVFDVLGLETEEVGIESLSDNNLVLIADEIIYNSNKDMFGKITAFVRIVFEFAETDEHLIRLFTVLDRFRIFLEKFGSKTESSLISGTFSLAVVEQIVKLNVEKQLKIRFTNTLESFSILVLRTRPCFLECSVEFIKLFCQIMERYFTVILLAVNVDYIKKFAKNWLLVERKVLENNLLMCFLKYIVNENEPQSSRNLIAGCLTCKEFLFYFHNSIKNNIAFDLMYAALALSNIVHKFTSEEYLFWLYEGIVETNQIFKKRYFMFYDFYRCKIGHSKADILQDIVKAFSYEDTCQKLNDENIEIIWTNIPYVKNPMNLVQDCILQESFNDQFGHISFPILKTIVSIASVKIEHNITISSFLQNIPEILKHFNNKCYEKIQTLDILLSLQHFWKPNIGTVSIF